MGPSCGERPVRLLISAGEASGDMHGAALLRALRQLASPGRVECFGLGGERLRAAGCEIIVDAKDVAVVGLSEVVSHLPRIYREFRRLLEAVDRRRPDAAVLIDFPEFNFRLARQLHRRGIPVIYYVSPQLWAWRRGRLKLVRRYVRKMLVIFPFEREFYRRHGVEVEFVGHPLADPADPGASGVASAMERDCRQIALLPGSRRKEIELNLPAMLAAAVGLHARHPELHFTLPVASTIRRAWLAELIGKLTTTPATAKTSVAGDPDSAKTCANTPRQSNSGTGCGAPELAGDLESGGKLDLRQSEKLPHVSQKLANVGHHAGSPGGWPPPSPFPLELVADAQTALAGSQAAVVASGTATLEAALAGTPFVMVYRLTALTWLLGRRLVEVPFFCIVNLIAGREIVPELVQRDFTPLNVAARIERVLAEGPERQQMLEGLREVRARLSVAAGASASEMAAREILKVIRLEKGRGKAAPSG
jgi:lipid A disaccharide synthetase